jgi:hypothetical protein
MQRRGSRLLRANDENIRRLARAGKFADCQTQITLEQRQPPLPTFGWIAWSL